MADILNKIISFLLDLLGKVLFFLPDSPMKDFALPSQLQAVLGYMNYFLPLNAIVVTLGLWTAAIGAYLIYQVILRLVKAIE